MIIIIVNRLLSAAQCLGQEAEVQHPGHATVGHGCLSAATDADWKRTRAAAMRMVAAMLDSIDTGVLEDFVEDDPWCTHTTRCSAGLSRRCGGGSTEW